jgi:ligand-binding sensor domain-containing protein
VNRFDAQQHYFMRCKRDGLSHEAINSVFVDSQDTLWIGFAGEGGFGKFDGRTKILRRYNPVLANKGHYYVDRFFEDRQGNLWIGAEQRQFLFDRRTGQCRFVKPAHRAFGWGRRLLEDQNGTVWSWWRSLYKLNVNDVTSTHFFLLSPPDVWTNISFPAFYNHVQFAYVDAKNKIWCGTLHGLYQFDPIAEKVTASYYTKDGLPSDLITKITADDAGRLWLLTGAGVSIFDETAPPGKQFTNLISRRMPSGLHPQASEQNCTFAVES